MPSISVSPLQRIVSSTGNVVTAANRAAAVTSLLAGGAPNAVNVGNAPLIWPQISKFDNDNNAAFNSQPNPQFLWTQPVPLPGETKGFAARSSNIPLSAGVFGEFVIAMAVFADNAVTARIQASSDLSVIIIPGPSNLNVDLNAGSLNPNTGIFPDNHFPYNWQNVRFYTIPVSFGVLNANLNLSFVFSFEVANYVNNGATNTAGLAFVADIYQSILTLP